MTESERERRRVYGEEEKGEAISIFLCLFSSVSYRVWVFRRLKLFFLPFSTLSFGVCLWALRISRLFSSVIIVGSHHELVGLDFELLASRQRGHAEISSAHSVHRRAVLLHTNEAFVRVTHHRVNDRCWAEKNVDLNIHVKCVWERETE